MPDENRFAGLGDQLGSEEASDSDEEPVDTASEPDPSETESAPSAAETDDASQPDVESAPAADSGGDTASSGPAFAFDDTQAKSLYVRPETVELLEDAEFEVEAVLRREHGIRDLTGREFHDALVRAVAADPEAVADLVVDAREE